MELRIVVTFFGITLVVALCAVGCNAQCTPNYDWAPVLPESSYDRNLSSLNDVDGRPLGFKQAILEYQDNESPVMPCIQVTGAQDRRIEIMAESDPPGSILCLRDQSGQNPICLTQIYSCRQAIADSVNFEFFCDADSCDESAVTFWYRMVLSEDPEVQDPELWCDSRNVDEYPSSLNNRLPPDTDLEPADPDPPLGGATSITIKLTAIMVAPLLALLLQSLH